MNDLCSWLPPLFFYGVGSIPYTFEDWLSPVELLWLMFVLKSAFLTEKYMERTSRRITKVQLGFIVRASVLCAEVSSLFSTHQSWSVCKGSWALLHTFLIQLLKTKILRTVSILHRYLKTLWIYLLICHIFYVFQPLNCDYVGASSWRVLV